MAHQFRPEGYNSHQIRPHENQASSKAFKPTDYQGQQRKPSDNVQAFTGLMQAAFDFWAPVYTATDGTLVSPGFDGPTTLSSLWDKVCIQTLWTPGLAHVDVKKGRDVDKKKAAGGNGARITVHGVEPAIVQIDIMIWTPEQLKALKELVSLVLTFSNKRPNTVPATEPWPPAFDVQHPAFTLNSVTSLVFTRLEGPKDGPVTRAKTFTIHAVEYMKQTTANATATVEATKGSLYDPGAVATPGTNPANTGITG